MADDPGTPPAAAWSFISATKQWITILRSAGFVVDALHELYAPPGGPTHPYYGIASPQWASRRRAMGRPPGGAWSIRIMVTRYDEAGWRR